MVKLKERTAKLGYGNIGELFVYSIGGKANKEILLMSKLLWF